METSPVRAYSRREWAKAVCWSAFLGWSLVALFFLIAGAGITLLPWVAGFGLPISFIVCWVVVAPALALIMRSPISWKRATFWGAIFGVFLTAIYWVTIYTTLSFDLDEVLQFGQYAMVLILSTTVIALAVRAIIGPGVELADDDVFS